MFFYYCFLFMLNIIVLFVSEWFVVVLFVSMYLINFFGCKKIWVFCKIFGWCFLSYKSFVVVNVEFGIKFVILCIVFFLNCCEIFFVLSCECLFIYEIVFDRIFFFLLIGIIVFFCDESLIVIMLFVFVVCVIFLMFFIVLFY